MHRINRSRVSSAIFAVGQSKLLPRGNYVCSPAAGSSQRPVRVSCVVCRCESCWDGSSFLLFCYSAAPQSDKDRTVFICSTLRVPSDWHSTELDWPGLNFTCHLEELIIYQPRSSRTRSNSDVVQADDATRAIGGTCRSDGSTARRASGSSDGSV